MIYLSDLYVDFWLDVRALGQTFTTEELTSTVNSNHGGQYTVTQVDDFLRTLVADNVLGTLGDGYVRSPYEVVNPVLFRRITDFTTTLYERWLDERPFAKVNQYERLVAAFVEFHHGTVYKFSKRPFGFVARLNGVKRRVTAEPISRDVRVTITDVTAPSKA